MPDDLYARINRTFTHSLVILGPLYADSGDGNLVIFGFGLPADTSEQFASTLGLPNYLLPSWTRDRAKAKAQQHVGGDDPSASTLPHRSRHTALRRRRPPAQPDLHLQLL